MYNISVNIQFSIDSYSFQILRITNGFYSNSIPSHSHSSYEIHYVEEGYGQVIVDNKIYELSPNTIYITGPNIQHEQCPSVDFPMKEFSFYCKVTSGGDNEFKMLQVDDITSIFLNTRFWIGQDTQEFKQSIYKLENEIHNRYIGYDTVLKSIFENIIVSIVRNYNNVRQSIVNIPVPTTDENRFVIIENSFLSDYKELTLESLAKKIGLSKRHTSRILHDYYKATFQEKKMQARMSAAMNLILNSKMSIGQIAEATGFSSTEYFCNAFKKYYGEKAGFYKNKRNTAMEIPGGL
jgi:AraC-like DNA-binding protein